MMRIRSKSGIALLVAMASLLIYGLTCCRTVYVGDAGELTLALSTGGIAHPPGYPLYTVLGYLWLWLFSFLRPAMAANLFSGATAVAASVLLFMFFEKIKTKSFPVLLNASLSLLFAFSFPLWSVATNAEVYAFSALLYNAAMLSIVSFYQAPQERRLLIAVFFCGLVLTHHFSAAVVLATLLLTIIISRKILSHRTAVIAIAVLLLPLTLYLYLFLRFDINLPVNWLEERSFSALWGMVSGRMYQSLVGWPSLSDLWLLCRKVALSIGVWFGPGVALLAVPGLVWGMRKKLLLTLLVLIPAALNILMVSFYHIPDFEGHLMPLVFSLFFLFYLSFEWIIDKRLMPRSAAIALAILLVAVSLFYNYSRCDLHDFRLAERYGKDLLDSVPCQRILFLKSDNACHTAMYLRYLENYRPDIEIYTAGSTLARLKQGIDRVINQGMIPATSEEKLSGFLYGPTPVSRESEIDRSIIVFAEDSLSRINLHDDLRAKQIYLEYQLRRLDQLIAERRTSEVTALSDELYRWGKEIKDPHTCLAVAQYFRNQGMTDRSLLWVELAQKATPFSYEWKDIYVNLGMIYRQRGDAAAALEVLNRALEIDPNYLPAKYNLNLVRAEEAVGKQDWPSALAFFKILHDLEPENSLLYFNMAIAHEKISGHVQDAIDCYEKFIQLDADQHPETIRQAQERITILQKTEE